MKIFLGKPLTKSLLHAILTLAVKANKGDKPMNNCVKCHSVFSSWKEYSEHQAMCFVKMIPYNVSGRTKEEIVGQAENTFLASFVLDASAPHVDECRCQKCFNAYLDKVVAFGEASLQN